MDYQHLCTQVVQLSKEVGTFLMTERKNFSHRDIETKGTHDYVTYVDKRSERQLVDALSVLLPGSGFIAEEGTSDFRSDDYNWIIDPLDGTTNYIHALPPFCVSIGLMYRGSMVMGVIHEPNLNETFYAWKDSKAYLNGKEIEVSKTSNLDQSLLATGFPYYDYSKMDAYMELFKWCMIHTRGIRRLGSAAIDLAYTACGRVDGFFEYGLRPWDVAAGVFIVQQAGGKISDFSGGEDYIFGKELLAFNALVFEEFKEIVKQEFSI